MVKRDGYSINLHPSPKLISTAFMSLIESFGWDSFTILYQVEISRIKLSKMKLSWIKLSRIKLFRIKLSRIKLCRIKHHPLPGQPGPDQAPGVAQVFHGFGLEDGCPSTQFRG